MSTRDIKPCLKHIQVSTKEDKPITYVFIVCTRKSVRLVIQTSLVVMEQKLFLSTSRIWTLCFISVSYSSLRFFPFRSMKIPLSCTNV